MKNIYLILMVLSWLTKAKCQETDTCWFKIDKQNISREMYFYASHCTDSVKIIYRNGGDSIARLYPASFMAQFGLQQRASSLNVQYLNDSVWYLYGERVEYAIYPFILKSTDRGNTWVYVLNSLKDQDHTSYRLTEGSFSMVNENIGVWFHHKRASRKGKFTFYRITFDGGLTWNEQKVRRD